MPLHVPTLGERVTEADIWAYVTRILTDPDSYKADLTTLEAAVAAIPTIPELEADASARYTAVAAALVSIATNVLGIPTTPELEADALTRYTALAAALAAIPPPAELIKSDKDNNFTTAIAVNAKEDENLAGLAANKILIVGVAIESDEQKHYRVLFWRTDGFDDADLDVDSFIGAVDLDLTINGFQIGAVNQWYWDEKLGRGGGLEYEDEDGTNELHISLQNLGPGAKTADADGEVVIKVSYVPLE